MKIKKKTKKKKTQSKTKRDKKKYPNLSKQVNLKSRQNLIDYDYINKLSDEEKKWLDKFTKEYTNASIDTKNLENNLHNTIELKKDCFDRNNARNRDLYSKLELGASFEISDFEENMTFQEFEEYLIKKIDENN